MSLVTLQEMKDYLGIADSSYDDFLNREIGIVSTAAYNYCARIFDQQNYTQTIYADSFDEADDTSELYLYQFPAITITSINLVTKSSDGSEDTEALTDYRLKKNSGLIYRTYSDGSKRRWFDSSYGSTRIEITYDAGYAAIPDDLKSVAYSLVAERYNKDTVGVPLDFGSNVQRISVPGVMGIDYDYSLSENERKTAFGMILGNYVNILDFHRSERALIGEIGINYVEVN